jgi:two-component system phosphate regulon sensor histidine kinase PhoR
MHSLGGKTVDVNVVPILNNSEDFQGVLVVLNDITSIKKLEQIRKDFVANVSHELKTPVAAISGFAETLVEEEGENPETVKEFSQIIFDESQRLSRLVNRLLELSRLESDSRELHIEQVNINQLIQDTISMMQKRNDCQDKIIDFKKADSPVMINGDADVIAQVLINLLDNAIKYGPDGDHIVVSVAEQDNEVKISVEDHGVGIPENETERVFERFYRVDKARSRKTGGTGLGLAIAKHLVENHGGQIGVETITGKGTIFSFTVPNKG